jgi:anthranilate/para-aminobenzoate synthase component II
MALRHTVHPAEGLQFHPEAILTTHGSHIIRNFSRAAHSRRQATGRALAVRA